MKNYIAVILLVITAVILGSCRDDFAFQDSTGDLVFSQDTVFLDTVFSNIGSSTRTFKVYNRSNEDIVIPTVALALGTNSKYRLAVDGVPGQVFDNVEILAKDSIFVYVETTVDINDFSSGNEFLYTDTIEFDTGPNLQEVELITLIQDAIFLFPERDAQGVEETLTLGSGDDAVQIRGFVLDDSELNFTADKPYVIYGFAAVGADKVLSIDPGARIHFHANSGIIVGDEGSLQVNGALSTTDDLENEVIFEGDRLEPQFTDVPGQWFGLWLTNGSKNNIINHATIRNATVGILSDNSNPASIGPTLQINNTQIYNSANIGLLGTTADIEATNMVINNAGQNSILIRLGGTYTFNNCTIANYWRNGFRQEPAVLMTNVFPNTDLTADLTATFSNSIIFGDRDIELILADDGISQFNFSFENSLIKFDDRFDDFVGIPVYDFTNSSLYNQVIFNIDPVFENEDESLLRIDNTSGANGIANPATDAANDLLGTTRPATNPDAGAYESVDLGNI